MNDQTESTPDPAQTTIDSTSDQSGQSLPVDIPVNLPADVRSDTVTYDDPQLHQQLVQFEQQSAPVDEWSLFVLGTPNEDAAGVSDPLQHLTDDCAVVAQKDIIETMTGRHLDEGQLVQEAIAHHWYFPGSGATPPKDIGKLLTLHHIPYTRYPHATIGDLADQLAQGHKVIVGVDGETLTGVGSDPHQIDHAVVVTGIDVSDPTNPQVLVDNPATGQAEAHYPLTQFIEAVGGTSPGNAQFFMVATDNPAPPTAAGMANFDYQTGHIPEVAGIPYEDFAMIKDQPDAVQSLFDQATEGQPIPSMQEIAHAAYPNIFASAEANTWNDGAGVAGHSVAGELGTLVMGADHALSFGDHMQIFAPDWAAMPHMGAQPSLDNLSGSSETVGPGSAIRWPSDFGDTGGQDVNAISDDEWNQILQVAEKATSGFVHRVEQVVQSDTPSQSGAGDVASQAALSDSGPAPDSTPLPSDPNPPADVGPTMEGQYQDLQHQEIVDALWGETPDPSSLTPSDLNELDADPQQFAADHGLAHPPQLDQHDM